MKIVLDGCAPQPMSAYLKALAVLRLVSEQADPEARGCWRGNAFALESALDRDGLEQFFLERYSPTPVVAPWNNGSGFYAGDRRDGVDAILHSAAERFRAYRETVRAIFAWPEIPETEMSVGRILALAEKAAERAPAKKRAEILEQARQATALLAGLPAELLDAPLQAWDNGDLPRELPRLIRKLQTIAKRAATGGSKEELIRACRNRLSDRALEWVDAAVVLTSAGEARYPPILGTGGNEGRLDYTNTFMCRVSELLLDGEPEAALLRNSLFAETVFGLSSATAGQYDPGRAGGHNQGGSLVNSWDFILTMEGAIAWTAGVGRRQGVGLPRHATSPFTVRARAVGYASAGENDREDARAEIWLPLWDRPARYEEIRTLLREGRAEIGGREPADGLSFAEAAAGLGVDRGITAFVRYSLLPRRGDNYVALPAGIFPVKQFRETDLLEDLDPVFAQVDALPNPPASLLSRRRALEAAVYEYLLRGGPVCVQAILAALGRLERHSRLNTQGLRPEWLLAADDGGLEMRLAAALASIGPSGEVGAMREYLDTAWRGNTLSRRIAEVLNRRMLDANRLGSRRKPLDAAVRLHPHDAAAFIEGAVDETRLEDLLWALTTVRWRDAGEARGKLREAWSKPVRETPVSRPWALLKHLFLPGNLRTAGGEEVEIRPEPSIAPLLCAGRIAAACGVAQRRLVAAGLVPARAAFHDAGDGVRIAAALLIPIAQTYVISNLILSEVNHVR